MLLSAIILALLFTFTSGENDTVSERFNNNQWSASARNSCRTRRMNSGKCMPLSSCPVLSQMVRQYSPLYVLQAASEYTCGWGDGGILVCCPDSGKLSPSSSPRPQPLNNWSRPQTSTTQRGFTNNNVFWGNPTWTTTQRNSWTPPTTQRIRATTTQRSSWNIPTTSPPRATTIASSPWNAPVSTWGNTQPSSPPNNGQVTQHRNRRLLPESACGLEIVEKIIGGKETTLEEFPWMALLQLKMKNNRTAFTCGGSLIADRYVLTAAHCIKNPRLPVGARINLVRLGEWDTDKKVDCNAGGQCSPPTNDIEVEEAIVHSKYDMNDRSQRFDIALLRLKKPAKISSYVQPICLPLDSLKNVNYDDKDMWAAGWGRTSNTQNSQSSIKLKVKLPVVNFNKCATTYRSQNLNLENTQMCAGGKADEDSCNGDSGGPLMSQDLVGYQQRWYVQGVVSIGPEKCGTAGSPGIYTRVSSFLDWILDNMKD